MEEQDREVLGAEIPLAMMIQTLRRELQVAQDQAAGEDISFEMEKVELELKVAITRKKKGQAGVEFWVVNAGGEYEKTGETAHTFKLTLVPISSKTGSRIKVTAKTTEKPARN